MRLVRVRAPEGRGGEVARLAFEAGIPQVSVHQQQTHKPGEPPETKDIVDAETSTPRAKAFVDGLMSAEFFDPRQYAIAVRQPRSVVSREKFWELTQPIVVPTVDVFEELSQFSHVTVSFVGRMLIGGMLLAYGMVEANLLMMIAGLLFLPLLPLLLCASLGALNGHWRLVARGLFALAVAVALVVAGGAAVGLLTEPPLRYNEFGGTLTAVLISLCVGVAGALATTDDVGRRELIGLAATAQIAIIPAWFGVALVFGFPQNDPASPAQRALTFLAGVATIIVASGVAYALLGLRGAGLRRFTRKTHG